MTIKKRFFHPPQHSFFLFGPRGTGKSTWLKEHYPEAIFIDLLEKSNYQKYSANPDHLIELLDANPDAQTVVIDEVQRAPELLSTVHLLIEKHKNVRFILTGSSSRKLKREGVDLLAGRAYLCRLHPFMAAELGGDFSLNNALQYGTLPVVWNDPNPKNVLGAYAGLYLDEEVKMEGLVRNVGNFSRFLEVMSFSHGSLLNTSEVSRECAVKRTTVEGYIEILEDLLLGFRLTVFVKKAKRLLSSHPKFYYFDAGIYRSLRPSGPLDQPETIDGAALEGLVAQHLRAYNDYSEPHNELYFWKTKSGLEVDFVVYGEKEFAAIEVKNTQIIRSKDLNGLKAFGEDYPQAKLIFLYRGKERLKKGNVLCLPCEEFLRSLRPDQPLI